MQPRVLIYTALAALPMLTGCSTFYKVKATSGPQISATTIDSLTATSRIFILRTPQQAHRMQEVAVNAERTAVAFIPDTLSPPNQRHVSRKKNKPPTFKKAQHAIPREVHLYTSGNPDLSYGNRATLALDQVDRMEVLIQDKGRTTANHIVGAVLTTGAAFLVLAFAIGSSVRFM